VSSDWLDEIKWTEDGLVPVIAQQHDTGRVVMFAWMNRESLALSLETGFTHFWSRSRQSLWKKGETSGHLQRIRGLYYDCDADALLVTVEQTGPACHTGQRSCFYRSAGAEGEAVPPGFAAWQVLNDLTRVIEDRKASPREGSYVNRLLAGVDLAQEKVLEESREVVEASREDDRGQVIYEAADLLFHLMVLLGGHGLSLADVSAELAKRFGHPPKKEDATKN
jgi:phosphoribosyl-ATP pyrophosphohydrolase/phosphoribosyl-AMP cyclohydrolase